MAKIPTMEAIASPEISILKEPRLKWIPVSLPKLKPRPVYHQLDNRIKAHFLVCYTALLIYRLLEVKLDKNGTHFTTENISETLRNMKIENIHDLFYKACYSGSDVLTALNQVFPMDLDKANYKPKDINKKIREILH